ncbi:MAG: sugar phosphate isomerase/epimerase family protein [Lachnospiraceae bacterium]
MKFGMHYIYWQKNLDAKSYCTHLEHAFNAGYDVLELGDDILFRMTEQELAELKLLKDEKKMELALGLDPRADGEFTDESSAHRDNGIRYYEQIFPVLEKLEIKNLGGRLLHTSSHNPRIKVQEADIERGKEAIAKLAASARNYGITLHIEVCNRYESHIVNTAEQGVRFLQDLNEPNVKLLLDTFHMNIEEEGFGKAILTAGKYLGHVHLVENNRRLPGRGHLPWQEIGVALKEIGYNGMLNMEPLVQTGGDLADYCRIWRDMTDEADTMAMNEHAKEALQFIKYVMQV